MGKAKMIFDPGLADEENRLAEVENRDVDRAIATGDIEAIWDAYKGSWNKGQTPHMDGETFCELFRDGSIAGEAHNLIRTSPSARGTLIRPVQLDEVDSDDLDVRSLKIALVLQEDDFAGYWSTIRTKYATNRRAKLAGDFVFDLIEVSGNEGARRQIVRAWALLGLSEEEQDRVIVVLDSHRALTAPFLERLGPEAEVRARLLLARGEIRPYEVPSRFGSLPQLEGVASSNARMRVAMLLQTVHMAADLRDGMLTVDEYNRVALRSPHPMSSIFNPALLQRALRRFHPMEWEEFLHELTVEGHGILASGTVRGDTYCIPLIRLLHMRLILDSPLLRHALAHPEQSMAPKIMLYLLGRESVSYVPEMRLPNGGEPRWRSHWAELTGEAVAVLFMEEALRLDLPTLARIPVVGNTQAPDFMAQTIGREPVVFEAKGSASWKTHRHQRREALGQLGKSRDGKTGTMQNSGTWAGQGRAFACSLFAGSHGDKRSTLFHLADPVFAFRHLFSEGWDHTARRHHYAALLESCEDYQLADRWLGLEPRGQQEEVRHPQLFRVYPESDERGTKDKPEGHFLGRFLHVEDMARRLGHPDPQAFRGIRLFRGLSRRLYESLTQGEIPRPQSDTDNTNPSEQFFMGLPPVGVLPGSNRCPRGIYSLLSDGSFLAVEVE